MPLPLSGSIYSPENVYGRNTILLGNQILHEGETLGDIALKKVNPDGTVVLTQNGQDFTRTIPGQQGVPPEQITGTFPEGAGVEGAGWGKGGRVRIATPEEQIEMLPVTEQEQTKKEWLAIRKTMNDHADKTYADFMQKAEMVEDPHLRTMGATQHLTDRGKIQSWSDELSFKLNQINEYEKYDDEQKQEAYKQLRGKMKASAPFPEALAGLPEPKLQPFDKAISMLDKTHKADYRDLQDEWSRANETIDNNVNAQKAQFELQRRQIEDRFGTLSTPRKRDELTAIDEKIQDLELDARQQKDSAYFAFQKKDANLKSGVNEKRMALDQIRAAPFSDIDKQNAYYNIVAKYMPTIGKTTIRTPEKTQLLIQQIEKEADQYAPAGAERTNFIRQRYHDLGLILPTEEGRLTLAGLQGRIPPTGAPAMPAPKTEAEYNALPKGMSYLHPDGTMKVKK